MPRDDVFGLWNLDEDDGLRPLAPTPAPTPPVSRYTRTLKIAYKSKRDVAIALCTVLICLSATILVFTIAFRGVLAPPVRRPVPPPVYPTSTRWPTARPTATLAMPSASAPTPVPAGLASVASPPVAAPAPVPVPSGGAGFSSEELTRVLRSQVEGQRAQLQGGTARFAPPNTIVLTGKADGMGQPVAVDVAITLTVGLSQAGRPVMQVTEVRAVGRPATAGVVAFVQAGVDQSNGTVDRAVPRTTKIKRVGVAADGVFGEIA